MSGPRLITCLAVALVCLALRPDVRADGPPAQLKTQTVTIRLADDALGPPIALVHIPGGKVVLTGPDGKRRTTEVKSVWVAQYETRWAEYDVFWKALDLSGDDQTRLLVTQETRRTTRPYDAPDWLKDWQGWKVFHDGYPANCVGLAAAKRYCAWLSKNAGRKFRLPTEAEWAYACRAGAPAQKWDAAALGAVAWFGENSDDKPHPVGQKRPNAWGLYDMLGNVGEYVIRDPKDEKGLIAGGAYKDAVEDVHCAARERESEAWHKNDEERPPDPDWLNKTVHHVGFRVVMEE